MFMLMVTKKRIRGLTNRLMEAIKGTGGTISSCRLDRHKYVGIHTPNRWKKGLLIVLFPHASWVKYPSMDFLLFSHMIARACTT